jgi:transposase-like protein
MGQRAKPPRENRTLTIDFNDEATYSQLLDDGQAFIEFVLAFLLSIGFQLSHKATCNGSGCLTRHSHYARVRLGGLTLWRIQCTSCKAVFTVLPHFVLRYRRMRPDVARQALIATHGGLSLEWCAVICNISSMALYRLICAFGQHSLVTGLTRCDLPLPTYILADEKHSRCLTDRVYLPTIVSGRVIWHLGYSESKSMVAFTESYGAFQRTALEQEPSYQVRGALTDGFDSTTSSMRTLFPKAHLGFCLRHALNKLPSKLKGLSAPVRKSLRSKFHSLLHRCRQRKSLRVVALGQRLRHFADHVTATVGEEHGERVRNWCQDKKAGWYAVLADPQMPAMSTVLDQAHNAIDRKLFMMKGFHHPGGSQGAFLTGLAAIPAHDL